MKIYKVEYRRDGQEDWWTSRGMRSNGIYTSLKTARGVATKLATGRWYTKMETRISEADVDWTVVETKTHGE
jgi:hypothetical protein